MPSSPNSVSDKQPLSEYLWQDDVDRLLVWLQDKDPHYKAFCFDIVMSAAFIEATSGIETSIEQCTSVSTEFNAHLGFINLCSPCYVENDVWSYQKAVKPQSGVLGKLSSEVILRFIQKLSPHILDVKVIGGAHSADAILEMKDISILAEVKAAPLLTYPFLFKIPETCLHGEHNKIDITRSQLNQCNSAIYMHGTGVTDLGAVSNHLWPFKPLVDFIISDNNKAFIKSCTDQWITAKVAYTTVDRNEKLFYLANASGRPKKMATDRDNWPKKESISDGKTSVGMDRTDDIKKGIYQMLKLGVLEKNNPRVKTALVSNLPAYRHGDEYVTPFINMLWGYEDDLQGLPEKKYMPENKLRRVFDFIITLEDPILRSTKL